MGRFRGHARATSLLALALAGSAGAASIEDPGQGAVELTTTGSGASQLSAITHAGGDRYYVVSDAQGTVYPAEIRIDPKTGHVARASVAAGVRLAGARDLEGIAWTGKDTVLVADEVGPAIREHRVSDGSVVARVAVPAIFRRVRLNLSLESLSLTEAGTLWTANEEALKVDGPSASADGGTWVRVQRFDADASGGFAAAGQWAYRTDPWPGGPLGGLESSGVVDLLALPEGEILALERSFSDRGFRNRIYQLGFEGAEDISALPGLADASPRPLGKTLLWEVRGASNFEGLTLGPPLSGGARSLVLVADDSGFTVPQVLVLRVRGGVAPPFPGPASAAPQGVK